MHVHDKKSHTKGALFGRQIKSNFCYEPNGVRGNECKTDAIRNSDKGFNAITKGGLCKEGGFNGGLHSHQRKEIEHHRPGVSVQ